MVFLPASQHSILPVIICGCSCNYLNVNSFLFYYLITMSGRWQNEGAQTSDDAVRDAEGRSLRPSVKCSMGVRWLTVS